MIKGEAENALSLLLRSMIHHGDEPVVPLWSRSAHDRAASLRLHRTMSAVEGGATFRPAVGPRNQT
jgi:hypothetical protein